MDAADHDDAGGLIGDLLSAARRNLGMDVAFIAEFTGGRRVFRFVDADEATAIVPGASDPLEDTYCQRIVDGELPAVIPDVAAEPVARSLAVTAELGIGSYAGVPINFPDGRVYGTLCCIGQDAADLAPRDRLALDLVADVVAAHLQRVEEHMRASVASRELVERILDDRQFHPVFQPIADLQSGRVVGVEALTRFTAEPAQGPDKWFALAHVAGVGPELELATLAAALEQIGDVPTGAYLSVNVSPSVLAEAVPLLRAVDGSCLVLEITEHDEIADYDSLLESLAELRARGIRVAIDDAGAGYSSLSHVLRLLPDIVKIDMSITRGVDEDLARQALARALVEFGGKLGATLVAEGIETAAELRMLASLGVACGQGYHLARPGPLPAPDAVTVEPGLPRVERVGVSDAVHFAFASNPLALTVTTVDGRFVEINDACARLFGRPAEEFQGCSWQQLDPAGDVDAASTAFGSVIRGDTDVAVLATTIVRPDGTSTDVEVRGRLVRDAQGRPLWFVNELEPRS